MRRKKKIFICGVSFVVLCIIGIIVGLLGKYCIDLKEKKEQEEEHKRLMEESIQEIEYINENSNLGEVSLMGPKVGEYDAIVGGKFRDGEVWIGEYSCWTFNGNYGITNIYITNPIGNILGITLGDSYCDAVSVLENRGYRCFEQSKKYIPGGGEGTQYKYQKEYVYIYVTVSGDYDIKELSVIIWDPSVDHRRGLEKAMYKVEQDIKRQKKKAYCIGFIVLLGCFLVGGYIRHRQNKGRNAKE